MSLPQVMVYFRDKDKGLGSPLQFRCQAEDCVWWDLEGNGKGIGGRVVCDHVKCMM